ncbi:MAG: type III secretion system chaperone [Desulfovibrio sp.]|nr:type III secretion system chaperone [Desulfovibrio sp.]
MRTMDSYKEFLTELRKQTDLAMLVPDETGLVTVRVNDAYTVNLQFVEATGKILCFVEVVALPKDAPKAVYRDLLVGGLFGRDTAGGFFTLEEASETVIYNYFFDGDVAARDPEEFVATLEKILQLCDIWADRISGVMTTTSDATDIPVLPLPHMGVRA